MKKWSLLIIALVLVTACGGGGSSSSASQQASISPEDPSNFVGTYTLRDSDCEEAINKMSITQLDDSLTLTIVDNGDTDLDEGEAFIGTVLELEDDEGDEVFFADFMDSLDFFGIMIADSETLADIDSETDLAIQVGDLVVVFGSDSCNWSFIHQS